MRAGIRDMGVAMKQFWKSLKSEQAASMVEYALLVVLIAIVALVAVQLAGSELSTTYSGIASSVENA
jgi:Flp pilus assembly pilin Flp